jgi:hypothetical protein
MSPLEQNSHAAYILLPAETGPIVLQSRTDDVVPFTHIALARQRAPAGQLQQRNGQRQG